MENYSNFQCYVYQAPTIITSHTQSPQASWSVGGCHKNLCGNETNMIFFWLAVYCDNERMHTKYQNHRIVVKIGVLLVFFHWARCHQALGMRLPWKVRVGLHMESRVPYREGLQKGVVVLYLQFLKVGEIVIFLLLKLKGITAAFVFCFKYLHVKCWLQGTKRALYTTTNKTV